MLNIVRRRSASSEGSRRVRPRARTAMVAVVAGASALALASPAAAVRGPEVKMSFDGFKRGATVKRVPGVGPGLAARVVTAHGGTVKAIRSRPDNGRAIRFPRYDGSFTGPRAVLRISNTGQKDQLNPGRRNFLVRADFRLRAKSSGRGGDNGDNLLQRGDAGTRHQYKIQLDGHQLSCLLENRKGARFRVQVHITVDAKHWYNAQCRRNGDRWIARLTMFNRKGKPARSWVQQVRQPGGFGVVAWAHPDTPLTVGGRLDLSAGKIPREGDQFNGAVDNVVVNILR